MLKKIKKSLKYLVIFFGVIILLPTVLYLLLQTAEIQTFLVKRITNHFSAQLKSTISVGSIDFKFFNRLSINDLLIKDQNNDTLLYSKEIVAGVRRMDFKNKSFRLGKISLIKPVIALITDTKGVMNLTWYLKLLSNPADTVKKTPMRLHIDQIDINNARFSLINRNSPKGKSLLDPNNLHTSGINGIIEDIKILNDTASFNIYDLGFKESSGFTVKKINSSVIIAKQNIFLKSASINCDSSIINISRFSLVADSSSYFKKFTEKVKLDLLLDKSLINTSDIKYFLPLADSMNESVSVSGKISGTISELRGRNIKLKYRNYTSLDCDFDFSGLPKIENTFLYIGVNSLRTNAKDLEKFSLPRTGLLIIPDAVKKLGNISFNGSFTGFSTDFVTYGEIRTSQGNIRTDISLRPEKDKRYRVKGLLTGSNINLGTLTGKSDLLGNVSMKANVDGYANSMKKFACNITGKIDSIEINRYLYRNITLNGSFTEKTWDGSIDIVDRNIKLNLLGLLNFNNKLPEFNFTLNVTDANLHKLNIDKPDSTSKVTLLLTSNFKGNSIDNLDGEIKLLNSKFRKFGNNFELHDFSIKTFKEYNSPVLSLRTDFVDAEIKGYYNFAGLGELVKSTMASLMPSQFKVSGKKNDFKKNKFTFNINFKNTDKINEFFKTGMLIADKSYIKGAIFADSIMNIVGRSDLLTIKGNVLEDLSFDADISGSELTIGITSPYVNLMGQSELKNFSVGFRTKPDSFTFTLNWDNKDKILNSGNIFAHGTVTKNVEGKPNALLRIDVDSSHIYSDNNLWKLTSSSILVDSNSFKVNKFYITGKESYYLVDGTVSENPSDTLHLELKGIDISPLNILLNHKKNNDPNMLSLDFKGHLNGKILLTNVYKSILLAGNIVVEKFSVLGHEFGNIFINSDLDNAKKIVNIKASNNLNSVKMFDIAGFYDPALKKIDLNAKATKLPIDFLNPLLKVFASDISGFASGRLRLTSQSENIFLEGAALVENASMKVNFLQTKYSLNDTIRFDKQGIKFNDVKIKDQEGNIATLSGAVYHKNLHEYSADLTINIASKGFLVLNTQPKDNPMFYGTAYVEKSVAKIKIDPNTLSFDISAKTSKSVKTGKNSNLSIPLNKGLSVSEYSYISFEDSTSRKKVADKEDPANNSSVSKQIAMDIKMNLEVTPDAKIQIIFDSKVGDIMEGNGSSPNLNITLNKKGDFEIFGDYTIERGTYTFTLGNFLLNKSFDVENGGKITFNGNLKNAEIDLKANYLKLKASLSPILGERYTERISVEPQMKLSGKLFNPIVGFDIYLPDADEQTRAYLKNAISTEEELTKQVFSLLLMNQFISMGSVSNVASASPSVSTTNRGTSAVAATTFEMVSNQISNWLSKLTKDVDIGINIRPGSNAISPQEAELALSTQILGNKVVLNGNFDVRGIGGTANTGTPSNTNQLTGDFDAELKLTEKLRFKVFNRFNDVYNTGGLSPYTQGVGIFYNQDFNKFSDLFRKKAKPDMKKEEELKLKNK
jgi:hypothetical protein